MKRTKTIQSCIITVLAVLSLCLLPALGQADEQSPPSAPSDKDIIQTVKPGQGVTLGQGQAIPSKEDILRMLKAGQGQPGQPVTKAAAPTETKSSPQAEEKKPEAKTVAKEAEQPEISPIESAFSAGVVTVDKSAPQPAPARGLVQFGYSFFKPEAPGFAALTDIPVGPDYVIGPGDKVILNAWGSLEGTYELEVNRSGEVVLPKVGAVRVWGVPFERLPGVINARLATVYKDFNTNVTLGSLKLIKVYVVGEVRAPGDYNLSSLSTLINALAAAGGPLKTGSLRDVMVKRGGKVVDTVDLYDFFLQGDKSRDVRLKSGDTVFIPVIGRVAGIAGNVKRPAIFELKDEKTFKELVDLAGGLLPTGYLERVQLSRVDAYQKRSVSDINLDPKATGKSLDELAASIAIQDMDLADILPIDQTLRGYVRLEGHVLRPGDYALKPGMRVKDLVRPEELLPEYYQGGAELTRLLPPDLHPEKLFFNMEKALAGDPENNVELKEFDTVMVFSRWEMEEMPKVTVGGEVQKPGQYRYFTGMTVRDILTLAGNPKRTAFLKNAEISRLDKTKESVKSYPINVNLEEALAGNTKENIPLAPFDELTVRRIPNWAEETDRYITIRGEVMFPGTYPIYRGEKLSSALERAGGFTGKAYLKGAKFTRVLVQAEQQKRMEDVIARAEDEISRKQGELLTVAASKEELDATKAALAGLMQSVGRLKSAKAEGRMVLYLTGLDTFKDGPYDLEIMGGDELTIPQTPKSVNVMGQVYTPTTFVHIPGKDVSYYLTMAGGQTPEADAGDMYIIKADGTVQSRQNEKGFFFFGSDFMSEQLDSGDTIVVPQQIERIAWMREIKDIAQILGNVALMAGVLVAAGL
jgi:polysaccharide export outer membrane protein